VFLLFLGDRIVVVLVVSNSQVFFCAKYRILSTLCFIIFDTHCNQNQLFCHVSAHLRLVAYNCLLRRRTEFLINPKVDIYLTKAELYFRQYDVQ
jgi:hypothetical protein